MEIQSTNKPLIEIIELLKQGYFLFFFFFRFLFQPVPFTMANRKANMRFLLVCLLLAAFGANQRCEAKRFQAENIRQITSRVDVPVIPVTTPTGTITTGAIASLFSQLLAINVGTGSIGSGSTGSLIAIVIILVLLSGGAGSAGNPLIILVRILNCQLFVNLVTLFNVAVSFLPSIALVIGIAALSLCAGIVAIGIGSDIGSNIRRTNWHRRWRARYRWRYRSSCRSNCRLEDRGGLMGGTPF